MEYSHILLYQSYCTNNTHSQNHYFDLFSCTFILPVLKHLIRGFPDSSVGKESACNAGDLGLIPGLGRSPGGIGYPLQYSGLENSRDCTVHGVAKSRNQMVTLCILFWVWLFFVTSVSVRHAVAYSCSWFFFISA